MARRSTNRGLAPPQEYTKWANFVDEPRPFTPGVSRGYVPDPRPVRDYVAESNAHQAKLAAQIRLAQLEETKRQAYKARKSAGQWQEEFDLNQAAAENERMRQKRLDVETEKEAKRRAYEAQRLRMQKSAVAEARMREEAKRQAYEAAQERKRLIAQAQMAEAARKAEARQQYDLQTAQGMGEGEPQGVAQGIGGGVGVAGGTERAALMRQLSDAQRAYARTSQTNPLHAGMSDYQKYMKLRYQQQEIDRIAQELKALW